MCAERLALLAAVIQGYANYIEQIWHQQLICRRRKEVERNVLVHTSSASVLLPFGYGRGSHDGDLLHLT